MKNIAIAAVLTVLSVTASHAADMAARTHTKAPPIAQVYSWTGFYAGVNAGYGWKDPSVSYTANDPNVTANFNGGAAPIIPTGNWNNAGALGGGQIGYNFQFSPQWLAGLEADIAASDVKGSALSVAPVTNGPFANVTANQKVEWFGTVRGRLGWLPTDRLLVFGTAGFAYGKVNEDVNLMAPSTVGNVGAGFGFTCTTGQPCFVGSSSGIRTGWTAGGGLEYALWQNLTLKAEYLYVDLGSGDNVRVTAVNGAGNTPSSFTAAYSGVSFNVVRGGLNYKF